VVLRCGGRELRLGRDEAGRPAGSPRGTAAGTTDARRVALALSLSLSRLRSATHRRRRSASRVATSRPAASCPVSVRVYRRPPPNPAPRRGSLVLVLVAQRRANSRMTLADRKVTVLAASRRGKESLLPRQRPRHNAYRIRATGRRCCYCTALLLRNDARWSTFPLRLSGSSRVRLTATRRGGALSSSFGGRVSMTLRESRDRLATTSVKRLAILSMLDNDKRT